MTQMAMKWMAMAGLVAALTATGFAGPAQARPRDGDFQSRGGFHGGGAPGASIPSANVPSANVPNARTPSGNARGDFRFRGDHDGFRRGFRGGVFFGGPLYDPFWYQPGWDFYYPSYGATYYSPYPYYYPYTDYGEAAVPALPPAQGWYYCSNPPGYYPSVPSCYTEWQYVPPQP
jgi:hypothetical protein